MNRIVRRVIEGRATPLELPKRAEVLRAAFIADELVLFVLCDDTLPARERVFMLYEEGEPIPYDALNLAHIDTIVINAGLSVLTVFEFVDGSDDPADLSGMTDEHAIEVTDRRAGDITGDEARGDGL